MNNAAGTSSNSKKKTCLIHEDCESSVTMSIRCRRGHLVSLLRVLAVLSFALNIYLIYQHGAEVDLAGTELDEDETSADSAHEMLLDYEDADGEGDEEGAIAGEDGGAEPVAVNRPRDMRRTLNYLKEKRLQGRFLKRPGLKNRRPGLKRPVIGSLKKQRHLVKPEIPDHMEPQRLSLAPNATFSACLLIKDDNEILNEWIAYHYHVINLRQLIVAVDPLSYESPSRILEKWRLMTDLDILQWNDDQYMPEDFIRDGRPPEQYMQKESDFKTAMSEEDLLEISNHRYRQRVFLAQCMRTLRKQGSSWVIHIDTDEYVVASKLLRQMTPKYLTIPPIEQPGSVLNLLQQAVNVTSELVSYPCISMLRVLFGSVESDPLDIAQDVPFGFNATRFESLRWRYHARPHNMSAHGNPKVILDVSAIPEYHFPKHLVFSIHRPVAEFCQKNKELAFTNFRKQPIAVNHYLGSWERYSGRNDKRRSRAVYDAKASVSVGRDDGLRPWLRGFVQTLGKEVATSLMGSSYLIKQTKLALKGMNSE